MGLKIRHGHNYLFFYYRQYSHPFCLASFACSAQEKIHPNHRSVPLYSFGHKFLLPLFSGSRRGLAEADFSSLEGVLILFHQATPEAAAAGWMHYLAFDFWVGCWVLRDAQEKQLPHGLIVLPLLFTLMMGPVGILLYTIFSQLYLRQKK